MTQTPRDYYFVLLTVMFLLVCSGARAYGDDKSNDLAMEDAKARQGTWVMMKVVIDGKVLVNLKEPPKDEPVSILTYDGDKWVLKLGDKELSSGTSRVNATKKPKQIDITYESGPNNGKTVLGIYELNGDEYMVCVAAPGMERPTDFSSKEGGGQTLTVGKREKH